MLKNIFEALHLKMQKKRMNDKKAIKRYRQWLGVLLLARAITRDDQKEVKRFQYYIDHSKDIDDKDKIEDE